MNWRYGVKRYDPAKKLTTEHLQEMQEAIRLAPSSYGLQPFKALFIENADLRGKLSIASFHQPQVTEASHLIVFAVETKIDEAFIDTHFANICEIRNVKMEGNLLKHRDSVISALSRKSDQEKLAWATNQAYLSLGFLLLAAADLHIDASAIEGFMPSQYDEILGLKTLGLHAVVIAAIGYRHHEDIYQHLVKVRRPAAEIFITL